MLTAAIIVAAGQGLRAAEAGARPKQYLPVGGRPVMARSLAAYLDHAAVGLVQPVIHPDHRALYEDVAGRLASPKLLKPVNGGPSRQGSVLAGLKALKRRAPELVLIHDAARPFIPAGVIGRVIDSLGDHEASLAALPLSDTLKAETAGRVARTISRDGLWRAQTPQGFHFPAILAAHQAAKAAAREDFTDDAAIAEWQGLGVALVMGSERNMKLTTPEDFELAERMLASEAPLRETRVGTGFDVHAFEPGDGVTLCGVSIPHNARLAGHSDADVGLHAIIDALLGTIAAGDIGQHFPPGDPAWKGADSSLFLRHTKGLLQDKGCRIVHVDVTFVCERPKIGPHREAMRARVAEILDVGPERISVKATTTEGLGFTGRSEGIAAMASATVEISVRREEDA